MMSFEKFRTSKGKTFNIEIDRWEASNSSGRTTARMVPNGLLVPESYTVDEKNPALTTTFVPCTEFEAVAFLEANEVKEEWKKDFP